MKTSRPERYISQEWVEKYKNADKIVVKKYDVYRFCYDDKNTNEEEEVELSFDTDNIKDMGYDELFISILSCVGKLDNDVQDKSFRHEIDIAKRYGKDIEPIKEKEFSYDKFPYILSVIDFYYNLVEFTYFGCQENTSWSEYFDLVNGEWILRK